MNAVLRDNPQSVSSALSQLGVTEKALLEAVRQGYLARTNSTANHPPLFPSFVAWGETVCALREQLAPMGWTRNDDRNYSRTMHPEGCMAIAVATASEATGIASGLPTTKSSKGPSTIGAVEANRLQAWLPTLEPLPSETVEGENKITTWLLLIHHGTDEIRSELSLPVEIGADGRVSGWEERILLPAIPLDSESLEITPPFLPDVDVEIRRKA